MTLRSAALGFLLSAVAAHGQHLVFTMVTPASAPLMISAVSSSRDYGFQSLTLVNDSDKTIESVLFRVTINGEVVDGGRVFAALEPGEIKSINVFLGRMTALIQRARELRVGVARAIVTVDSVDFSNGIQWTRDEQPVWDIPIDVRPVPPR
jgi:hypothetical protein